MNLETIVFENNTLIIINQRELPNRLSYSKLENLSQVINSIKTLEVRGAPAIGIVGSYGLYLEALLLSSENNLNLSTFLEAADRLCQSRPTAVNLQYAADRMVVTFKNHQSEPATSILDQLLQTAQQIHKEDRNACSNIGRYGADLIKNGYNILTHCNAGILATGGMGTALAPIYTAHAGGQHVHVYVDETRPVGQGTRLTYWELRQNAIPATLITDNMAGCLMQLNKVNMVIVGADRIAANGDVANKIGTYGLAILAKYHRIPFYVAAPTSTIDRHCQSGDQIQIEHRSKDEVLNFWHIESKDLYDVFNPAFDITPATLISAIITEKGVIHQPFIKTIKSIT